MNKTSEPNKTVDVKSLFAAIVVVVALLMALSGFYLHLNTIHASADEVARLYGRWAAQDKMDLQKKIWQLEELGCTSGEHSSSRTQQSDTYSI